MKKAYLISEFSEMGLECSYEAALREEGIEVRSFSYPPALAQHIRFGKLGRIFHRFVSVDQWIQKLNKQIAVDIKRFEPDIVFVFTNAPVQPGCIGFVKSLLPVKFVLVWPDTLLNMGSWPLQCSSMYDAVVSHGKQILPVLQQMGFKNPFWSPFAADKQLHYFDKPATNYDYDISFVGSWNGEREEVMAAICKNMPQYRIAIYGPGWNRAKNANVVKKAINKPLRGNEYAKLFNRTFININVIGEIAYPSVNMRFFEIPVANGLQLVNYSPEQAGIFLDKKHLLYFDSTTELLDKIIYYISHPDEAMQIRKAGHEMVCAEHTYQHRISKLLQQLQTLE
ncbi:hypothetical protein FAM09_05245 [Niastella caeni]|uniref:Spore protein YkvP/CgeB glycosyl transferase-like domain-containing protein n=1 Tax=Niastella caeni TaxID=2569763 RepID=A0A4S8I3F6_9BACT|nr:glycosyltransferase [Niastella caeni]THU41514.1 hypothetical protein FAM09_05245 [Niastella caeni]